MGDNASASELQQVCHYQLSLNIYINTVYEGQESIKASSFKQIEFISLNSIINQFPEITQLIYLAHWSISLFMSAGIF